MDCEENQIENVHEISLAWRNLQYEVKRYGMFGPKKKILQSLNGSFEFNSLNALMGPSGAGKTTLLNILSGNSSSSTNSEIYLGNESSKASCCFIAQHVHESIVGKMTVRDIFRYAFKFKNKFKYFSQMNRHIDKIIKELMLPSDIMDRYFVNCSGGEQKRIAIGQELMSIRLPTFLFVDEPTTGLDSAAALEVVKCLKQLTQNYRITVIASIHSPSSEILKLFDKLYVLAKGGVCVYSGKPNQIEDYLKKYVEIDIPVGQPPIEVLIRLACNGIHDVDVQKMANHNLPQEYHRIFCHLPKLALHPNGLPNRSKFFSLYDFYLQFFRLSYITFVAQNRALLLSILLFVVFFSILATLFDPTMTQAKDCFAKEVKLRNATLCLDSLENNNLIKENNNFLANVLIYTGVVTICVSTVIFSSIVKIFKNEHRNHWYSLGVFYWSSIAVSFLELAITAFLNGSLGYFLPSQHSVDNYTINWNRFGHYIFFTWLLCFYVQSIGQLIGAIFVNHTELALVVSLMFHTGASMINGFFVDTERADNPLIVSASSAVALKYVSWCIVYTFYGIDRCDPDKEYSEVMKFFHLDSNDVKGYVLKVLTNVLVVRAMTLIVMYIKFNTFNFRNWGNLNIKNGPILIDFTSKSSNVTSKMNNEKQDCENHENKVQVQVEDEVEKQSKNEDDDEEVKNVKPIKYVVPSRFGSKLLTELKSKIELRAKIADIEEQSTDDSQSKDESKDEVQFKDEVKSKVESINKEPFKDDVLSKEESNKSVQSLDGELSNKSKDDAQFTDEVPSKNEIKDIKQDETQFNQFSHDKISIAFRDLSLLQTSSIFEIGSRNQENPKMILRNLNGQFEFGTLNALMGTSGAGKTSLLKVLNGQYKTRVAESTQIYLSRYTSISTCFITQEVSGHLMPGLTAKQSLIYASRLKNFRNEEVAIDHEKIALRVLEELNLLDTVDTMLESCSGGERKRLALAAELTATEMPNLICIDEPTSGLDSNSAETVISCLSKLTQLHPITILASIHQPNSSILSMFDQLYVLARGGVCIYSGAPNQIQLQLDQIQSEQSTSTSKYAIETLINHSCLTQNDEIVQSLIQIENLKTSNFESKLNEQTYPVLDGVTQNRARFSISSIAYLTLRHLHYFKGHLWKKTLFFSFNYLFYGFIMPQFYDRSMIHVAGCIDIDDEDLNICHRTNETEQRHFDLVNNAKYNYFYVCFFTILVMIQCSLSFMKELKLFMNEHRNGWYSSGAFYLVKSVTELAPLVPIIFIYVYLVDWYESIVPGIYWYLIYLLILGTIAFQGMAHVFAVISRGNVGVLIILSITVFIIFSLLSNFLLLYSRLHYFYQFLSNIAASRFLYEALMLLQYGFGRCGPKQIQGTLYSMGLKDEDYRHCIVMLLFNILFYRLIAIALLIRKANQLENRRKRVTRIAQYRIELKPSSGVGLESSCKEFKIKLMDI